MRRGAIRAVMAAAAMLAAAAMPARADDNLEYAVKAAYLAKFIPFIDWPGSVFPDPGAPFTICVLGDDPFGANLDKAATGQKLGDHPFQVRRMAAPDPTADCQMAFAANPDIATQMVEAMKDKPVVTVTDSDIRAHGMISFVVSENHVRFDIDDDAAEAVGIHVSSKLLGLANSVKRRASP